MPLKESAQRADTRKEGVKQISGPLGSLGGVG
jgi:hypothetical protein